MATNFTKKGILINEIIGTARNAAFLANKHFDGPSLFFSLAFMPVKDLKNICKSLGIKA